MLSFVAMFVFASTICLINQYLEVLGVIVCCYTFLPEMILHNWNYPKAFKAVIYTVVGSLRTVSGPILKEYWTGGDAIWLVDFSYWPIEVINLWNSHFCDSVRPLHILPAEFQA